MKVPKISCQVMVITPDNKACRIVNVDHIKKNFMVDCRQDVPIHPFTDYNPAPTMENFRRAIAEWDYHYRVSDDPRRYEEGKEMEQALIELFRALPQEDQHACRKIVEIVVMSTERK